MNNNYTVLRDMVEQIQRPQESRLDRNARVYADHIELLDKYCAKFNACVDIIYKHNYKPVLKAELTNGACVCIMPHSNLRGGVMLCPDAEPVNSAYSVFAYAAENRNSCENRKTTRGGVLCV